MNGATGRRWPAGVGVAGRASGVKLLPLPSTCAFSYHNNLYCSPQGLPRLLFESSGIRIRDPALCSYLRLLNSLSLRRYFFLLLEDDWRRRVLSWMIQIRAGSFTRRNGVLATNASCALILIWLSQIRHNYSMGHGTSASGSAVYTPTY